MLGTVRVALRAPGLAAAALGRRRGRAPRLAAAIEDPDGRRARRRARRRAVGLCTAYLDCTRCASDRAWVEDLAVSPDRRSQGVGKALLDAAKDWARERGATHLELDSGEARADAHRFYEREGPAGRSRCFAWEL